jgi:CRP/FNR family transcriptional regulator, cyclic AMP receptor protein
MTQLPPNEARVQLAQIFACAEDVSAQIHGQSRSASYPPRAIIVSFGVRCEHVYIVLAGRARARAFSLDGRQAVLEDFTSGDIIGESALLTVADSAHEVVAIDLVEAAVMLAHAMVALMSTHASVALAISRRMIARLAEQNRRLAESSTLSATGRIHAELLRLARETDDLTIRPAPVLSQLAMHVQSTRETVSRTISALDKRGIIRRDDAGLTVVAEHRLEELVY